MTEKRIPFRNNRVQDSYKLSRILIDMGQYDTSANQRIIKGLLQNPEFVEVHEDGRMIWKGTTDKNGYALIKTKILPDRPEGDDGKKTIRLHRLLQQMFNNGAPVNAYVCHRDDNPLNIAPDNLFQGTPGNNSLSTILNNGRVYPLGEDHWSCKISDASITEMIFLHFANVKSIKDLAVERGISSGYASRLINGHARKSVTQKAIKAAIYAE